MSTIWKFNLDNPLELVAGKYASRLSFKIFIPSGARLLYVGHQHNENYLWALVDPDNPPEPVSLVRMGTGGKINNSDLLGEYLGTVQNDNGLVWHFFVVADQLSLGDGNESYE